MKTNNQVVRAEFAPEIEFRLDPARRANSAASEKTNLDEFQAELLAQKVAQAENEREGEIYRRAAQEAARLARITDYPALVFPVLFEEKTNAEQGQLLPPGIPCASRYDLATV